MKAVDRRQPRGETVHVRLVVIKQSIKRALANQSKTIRLPVHLVDKISKMRRTAMRCRRNWAVSQPTRSWVRNWELRRPRGADADAAIRPASLDAPIGERLEQLCGGSAG